MPKEQALISPRFTLSSFSLSNKSNNEKKKKKKKKFCVVCVSLYPSLSAFSLYVHDDDYYTDFMTPTREFNLIRISFRPHFARISISFRPHLFSHTPGFSSPLSPQLIQPLYPIHNVFFLFIFFVQLIFPLQLAKNLCKDIKPHLMELVF